MLWDGKHWLHGWDTKYKKIIQLLYQTVVYSSLKYKILRLWANKKYEDKEQGRRHSMSSCISQTFCSFYGLTA